MKTIDLKDWERAAIERGATQVRRVIEGNFMPTLPGLRIEYSERDRDYEVYFSEGYVTAIECPFGSLGDTLAIAEDWSETCDEYGTPIIVYRSGGTRIIGRRDGESTDFVFEGKHGDYAQPQEWETAEAMPPEYSRLCVVVEAVRVERVQEITNDDAAMFMPSKLINDPIFRPDAREYWSPYGWCGSPRTAYRNLIESDVPGSWDANPWQWVCHFRKRQ